LGGTLAFTRAPGENVGNYLITPSGLTSGNYNVTFNTGTLSITPAALSVTAEAKTKTYGATDPVFTASYAGFVNNETVAVLGGTLTFTRAPGEDLGSYLITPGGLTSVNYNITFNTGTLSITPPAPMIISLSIVNASDFVITWGAVSNGNYRVQYKPDLNANNWIDLNGDITATGSTASKHDLPTGTMRFYRIQVLP
jgi:MBG domain-containing protein